MSPVALRPLASRLPPLIASCFIFLGLASAAANAADDPGFVPIFNGTSLEGWEGDPEFWSVQDGAIVGQTTPEKPTKGNTFLIWRDGPVDDFELTLEYRLRNHNSGVQYRSRDLGNFVVGGYQADIHEGVHTGILYEEKGPRQIMTQRGQRIELTLFLSESP